MRTENNIIKSKARQGNTFVFITLVLFMLIFVSANAAIAGKKIVLSDKNIEIEEGKSHVLKLSGTNKKVNWSVTKGKDNVSLTKVKSTSVTIYGKKVGKATVQAKFKGKTYNCSVSVLASEKDNDANIADSDWEAVVNFGSQLFQNTWQKDKNIMVSPVSVFNALAMTANGAKGETLAQFEKVFGMKLEDCNNYLKTYNKSLPSGDKYKLNVANSIWVRNDFNTEPDFIQKNKDIFKAQIQQAAFDNSTVNDINSWVKKNTDGMIPEIIKEIPQGAQMYLINALAFDAEWKKIYSESDVREGIFTKESGETNNISLMYSEENTYIEDENVTGFIKDYADSKYAFVALLPKKGMSMKDYIKTLDSKSLKKLLDNKRTVKVNAAIPKFKSEYLTTLGDVLQEMGLTDAFNPDSADFSGMGKTKSGFGLNIDEVLHKTFIEVDERGTKAGAVTAVMMEYASTMIKDEEIKTVYLDRPFVYMLVDCNSWLPAFLGVVQDL